MMLALSRVKYRREPIHCLHVVQGRRFGFRPGRLLYSQVVKYWGVISEQSFRVLLVPVRIVHVVIFILCGVSL